MKRLSLFAILQLLALSLWAVLAEPGWKLFAKADGTLVLAQACGDEWHHWIEDREGTRYVVNSDGTISEASSATTDSSATARLSARRSRLNSRLAARAKAGRATYSGERKGLIVLVAFPDVAFSSADANRCWSNIANEPNLTTAEGRSVEGSVHDYYLSQSYGQFSLTFDVVGPIVMSQPAAYYGENDDSGNDYRFPELVKEACTMIADQTDFSRYDWNGDGEADQVFFLYAGKGENGNTRQPSLIWPHMYWMSGWHRDGYQQYDRFAVNDTYIDTYACACELTSYGALSGMGTICHEFSHCLGLPDLYDAVRGGSVIGAWDLMDNGNYNGSGWTPANLSAFERSFCGWLDLTELKGDTTVTAMQPLGSGGEAFIVRNYTTVSDADEYYVIENRQQRGWDSYLPGAGILVTHVDYDSLVFASNNPNSIVTESSQAHLVDGYAVNDHRRLTFVSPSGSLTLYSAVWPYTANGSAAVSNLLSDSSAPAATTFHPNLQGEKSLGVSISEMRCDNGVAAFSFADHRRLEDNNQTSVKALPAMQKGDYSLGFGHGLRMNFMSGKKYFSITHNKTNNN